MAGFEKVLRIRDVYPGSWVKKDFGSTSKNLNAVFLTEKNVSNLSEI
jgi:hypothetical protein